MAGVQRGGKKGRKVGRNRAKCQKYGMSTKLERSKVRSLLRQFRSYREFDLEKGQWVVTRREPIFKSKAEAAQHWHKNRVRRYTRRETA